MAPAPHYKGNKSSLPVEPRAACGRETAWRKRWAKNRAQVKYCSDACRQAEPPVERFSQRVASIG
jgi:hypothetical protein